MGKKELKKRKKRQDSSGKKAGVAEKTFFEVFLKEFKDTNLRIRSRPKEFKNIYSNIKLNKKILVDIYNPDREWIHGVHPDFAIDNTKTKKPLYIEVKRQDGWMDRRKASYRW